MWPLDLSFWTEKFVNYRKQTFHSNFMQVSPELHENAVTLHKEVTTALFSSTTQPQMNLWWQLQLTEMEVLIQLKK